MALLMVAGCKPQPEVQSPERHDVTATQTVFQRVYVEPSLLTNDGPGIRVTNGTTQGIIWKSTTRRGWETN